MNEEQIRYKISTCYSNLDANGNKVALSYYMAYGVGFTGNPVMTVYGYE